MEQNKTLGMQQLTAPIITVGSWIVTYLLLTIPIVNVIMLIIWAVSKNENPSRKNFAIATIIIWAIWFIIFLLFGSVFLGALGLGYIDSTMIPTT